jgi:CxxC-x17-CxxC domain-containing protein
MSDQQISCSECGDTFVFTEAEATFYREKGLAAPPKRCKSCRAARKAASGGDRAGGGGGRGKGPPRSGGGSGDYRSPRPAFNGSNGGNAGGNSWAPRGGSQETRSQARPQGRGDARGANGRGPSPRGPSPRGPSEYRSPAFPEQRWAPRSDSAPRSDKPGTQKRPRERDGNAAAPSTPRPERPKFDITCGACGVAAQVPFKPIEGREVFCQECYRARRGVARPEAEVADAAADADGGIVE